MDDESIKVNNFINECKQFLHYLFLNKRLITLMVGKITHELNVIIANGLCQNLIALHYYLI